MPDTPRVRMPSGVYLRPSARIVSAKPGASRSITARVASGVMSFGVSPVPPVVNTRSTARADEVVQPVLDQREVVGDDLHRHDLAAGLLGGGGELGAGEVLLLTARDGGGDGEDGGADGARAYAVAGSCARWAAAISSRTAASSPARSSSIGSGSPLTMPSKNALRSW